jgi:hypothetical protein
MAAPAPLKRENAFLEGVGASPFPQESRSAAGSTTWGSGRGSGSAGALGGNDAFQWEVAAALEVALSESNTPRAGIFAASPHEIAAALDAALPEEPRATAGATGCFENEPNGGPDVYEIPYDFELRCLMNDQQIDPRWVPSGMLWSPDQLNVFEPRSARR